MCFTEHRSGREWRCTFPTGFAGVDLVPVWFNGQLHIRLCWNASHQRKNRGFNFFSSKSKTFSRGYEILQQLQITEFFFSIHLNVIYSFGAFRGFFALWFPIPWVSCLCLALFVDKILCHSEILQSVTIHARMIFQRWAGLISLLGYNRQLAEDSLVLQSVPFSLKQGFRVFHVQKGLFP